MNWDQLYHEQHTPWDKGHAAPPLLEWIETHPGVMQGTVLVPGSGTGHDVRAIAASDAPLTVVGLDLSPKAVELASAYPRAGSEHYETGDLFHLEGQHRGRYDWIWEHTCFCAIDPDQRDAYVAAVHEALKPEGNFLGVFYLNPYDEEHQEGEGPPHGTSTGELISRFVESGKFRLVEDYVPTRSYTGREGLELVLRMTKN